VRLQLNDNDRNDPEVVSSLTIPSSSVGQVRLDNVASLVSGTGPVEIDRQSRQRQIGLVFNLARGSQMNTIIKTVGNNPKTVDIPPGYTTAFGGQNKMFGEMIGGFLIAFGLSIIFMYIVLAAQFESFTHPITIMLSLPLAVPFALLGLMFFRQQLSMFSILGTLRLFGIVNKN